MSNSSKSNTNQESVSYLILYSFDANSEDFDYDSYLIVDTKPEDIPKVVKETWDESIPVENIRVIPFYKSQVKRIKQTLELV